MTGTRLANQAAAETLVGVVTETAMGWAGVALSEAGIRHATLFHRTEAATRGELLAFGAEFRDDVRASEVAGLLRRYAEGEGDALDFYTVDLPACTQLQRDTWLALREIPCGQTRSYGWLAKRVGRGAAPRAIGAMVGANPIPLWLPCHRVLASDGSLHGFGGGLAMKKLLLENEGVFPKRLL
jgi:methylated-DNA-[protein]-cysteine S-methyltransferase